MLGLLSVEFLRPRDTLAERRELASLGSEDHWYQISMDPNGMPKQELDSEFDTDQHDEQEQGNGEVTREDVAAAAPLAATAAGFPHQNMYMPAAQPQLYSSMPMHVPSFSLVQAPMYYPLQQQQVANQMWLNMMQSQAAASPQQQVANPMLLSMMQSQAGAPAQFMGVMPAPFLPYNNAFSLQQQQQLPQGYSFNVHQAALVQQQLLQQNQGFTGFAADAGQYSALSMQGNDEPAAVTETETSSSQKTSSASTPTPQGATAASSRTKAKDGPKKPRRGLSAYNAFFKAERARMVGEVSGDAAGDSVSDASSGGAPKRRKIGFEEMGKLIGAKWKTLDLEAKAPYKALAEEEKERYKAEMELYSRQQRESLEKSREQLEATVSDATRQQYLASSGSRPANRKRKDTESTGSP